MRKILKKSSAAIMMSVLFILGGCGGASNNDQGTAVTLIGTFAEAGEAGSTQLPAGQTGAIIALGTGNSATDPETGDEVGGVLTYLGIQNNLSGQFYRTERVLLSYSAEGSSVDIPSTTMALSTIVGPSIVSGADGSTADTGSSLPSSFDGESIPNRVFAQTFVVPPAIMGFLNLNADSIFGDRDSVIVVVNIVVTGLTSAGDRLDTNEIQFPVIVKRHPTIPPTSGSSDAASN